jgi:hypothetical protein
MGVMITPNPEVVRAALDAGMTYFDTARVYMGGRMRRAAATLAVVCALAAGPAGADDDPAAGLPGETALAPLHRAGTVERHTAETLWERIDGEAELYRAHGLIASAHASYVDPANGDHRVEISVFTFADPLGAFGIFAAFRPPECAPVARVGNGGCLGDYQGFFWQETLFVLADVAGPEAMRSSDIHRALEAAAARLGPPPPPPEPLRAFSRFADTRSIRYQPQHLLGREALPPGLEGVASGLPVFVSVGPSNANGTRATLDAYALALEGAVLSESDGRPVLSGRDPALGPVLLIGSSHGIAGARSAPDAPGLRDLLETLSARGGDPQREGEW